MRRDAQLGLQRGIDAIVSEYQGLQSAIAELAHDVSAIVGVMADIVAQAGIQLEEAHFRSWANSRYYWVKWRGGQRVT